MSAQIREKEKEFRFILKQKEKVERKHEHDVHSLRANSEKVERKLQQDILSLQAQNESVQRRVDKLELSDCTRELRAWVDKARVLVSETLGCSTWENVTERVKHNTLTWQQVNDTAAVLFGLSVSDWKLLNVKLYNCMSNRLHSVNFPDDDVIPLIDIVCFEKYYWTNSNGVKLYLTSSEIQRAKIALVKIVRKLQQN